MRDLEDMRRNTAALRGSIDVLQKAQSDSSMQARIFYLEFDARIQDLKNKLPAAAPENAVAPAAESGHAIAQ
jgi:hypothetical protein